MEGTKVMYIRHAQSLFNFWELVLRGRLSEADKTKYAKDVEFVTAFKNKFDQTLADPHLSGIGREQAASSTLYDKLPIKIVFVSPLRRALETCDLLFSRHPNHANIRFIVHPMLREILNNANDVPSMLSDTRAHYEPKGYDFSRFDALKVPHLHFLYNLNSPDREELLGKLETVEEKGYQSVVLAAQVAKRKSAPKHHRKLESYVNMRSRACQFAAFLDEFIKNEHVEANQIAVVCHSTLIGYSQTTSFNHYNKGIYTDLPNCGYTLIDLSKLTK